MTGVLLAPKADPLEQASGPTNFRARGVGRIYGLDLGAAHVNPDGAPIGETHKNYWSPGHRDKWAFVCTGRYFPPLE